MTSETGSGRDAFKARAAVIPGETERAAQRRSRAASRNHRRAMYRIGLGLLLSLPFHKLVITAVIELAALAGLARENQVRTVARVAAWDKAQNLRRQGAAKIRPA
jgi:hypothetical protein